MGRCAGRKSMDARRIEERNGMGSVARHGWLKIPGVQDGDRTLAEQIAALAPALAECRGKAVLDLGCAEGLISLEFSKAGASFVLGVDNKASHLEVARRVCKAKGLEFKEINLKNADPETPFTFDIVLALGIIHKLTLPDAGLRFAARSAKNLLLLRSGRGSVNGIISGKHSGVSCDSHAILREEGFALEKAVTGPPPESEQVEYWRRR